ncbi:MAG: fhuA 1 [Cytophagaceae bacterium]|nr:fhuA 1 [Cytophagaceae bacterium]
MKSWGKLFSLLIAFCCLSTLSHAQSGKGAVKGKIVTSDSLDAELVTVGLKGTNKGATTNSNGEFFIENVTEGAYTLVVQIVGYETIEQPVEVKANETSTLGNIQLKEDAKTLHEVTVEGRRNQLADKESEQVARLPIKNIENPQVYSVVTQKQMEEQVVTNIGDALKNTPGTLVISYPSGGIGVLTRGFKVGINARNGMETVTGRAGTDFVTAERIEVIKGPSGTLFGSSVSSFGGVVNMVSKRPYETVGGNVSYSIGSFGLNRFTTDINLPVNKEKTVLFRFNGALNQENSFRDYGYNNTFTIAPSILLKVNNRLTLFADVEVYNVDQTRITYSRFPTATGFKSMNDVPLPYDKSLYVDDANALTRTTKYFLEGKYKFNENWTSTTNVSFVNEKVKQSYQYYNNWLDASRIARTVLLYGPITNSYTNVQQNFNGDVKTGFMRHRLLVGGNYRYSISDGGYTVPYNLYRTPSVITQNIDTINVYGTYRALTKMQIDTAYSKRGSYGPFGITKQKIYSAYVSDVINFTPKLSAMLSLRYDHFEQTRVATGATIEYQQDALSPKLGLVYQIIKDQLSVFGNYMNGFQNSGPVNQPDGTIFVPKPIYGNQKEVGVKFDVFKHRLTTTISYYDITINNATRVDANVTYQDGKQVSKGFEAELIANPISGLNILAGYVYNENKYIRSGIATEGKMSVDAPQHVANGWISYTFQNTILKNFGLGAGVNYADKSFYDAANTFIIPSYTVYNASVFYDHAKFRVALKVNNLSDERYWDLWGTTQTPRQFIANATYKF